MRREVLPDGSSFIDSSFQCQSQASLKFINFLKSCSKGRAEEQKVEEPSSIRDPNLNAHFFLLKWATTHFKAKTSDMILSIQNAAD